MVIHFIGLTFSYIFREDKYLIYNPLYFSESLNIFDFPVGIRKCSRSSDYLLLFHDLLY